jgi:putative nucleotidyltransferase with HDIG domain
MSVLIVVDSLDKLSNLRAMLEPRYAVSSALLERGIIQHGDFEAAIVAADLRNIENIWALKEAFPKIRNTHKRVFVVEQKTRLLVAQAYGLGATCVLSYPVSLEKLLAALTNGDNSNATSSAFLSGAQEAASAGASAISSMFSAVKRGSPIDVKGTQSAAAKIADNIADDGLSGWLQTVRLHYEGTYQHCLLVTGIAVDFGLRLGLTKADICRLHSAAMFHDIGKAKIPFAVLDKPGPLDIREEALIQTHPVAGYDILQGTTGISFEVLDAVRHHHEYLDGSGYPDGLCAKNIADVVRILTIADIFAALIEYRSYKPCMSSEGAYEVIRSMRGKLEGPLVAAFKDVASSR